MNQNTYSLLTLFRWFLLSLATSYMLPVHYGFNEQSGKKGYL